MRQFQDWELHIIEELLRLHALGKYSEDDDKLIWQISKSGKFLVKYLYSYLESDEGISFLSKLVRGSWVPLGGLFA